ncbi:MAG TPA: ABC transporter permease [Candidatus Sulfotelmatobacter sp.]|nr:ABC transporter permease [Candidatus Sulfotelmatobacter sp.]
MTAATGTVSERRWLRPAAWRNLLRDYPLIPLAILLLLLIVVIQLTQPGTVNAGWAAVNVRQATVLAILAGCQTLTMLTGGIDLSVAYIASMSGFVTATFVHQPGGWVLGVAVALAAAALAGLVSGIGIGVFRVHPLIMTLGMGLIVFGFSNVWQLQNVQTGSGVPVELRTVGTGMAGDLVPYNLVVFVPIAIMLVLLLRRTGFGRMLYAIGDNPVAARLSGVRSWQVVVVLYVISALLAAVAGLLQSGLSNIASVSLVVPYLLPSVAAAVIGGTSIVGGRGGYSGSILGALILTVLAGFLSIILPEPWRQIVFGSIVVLVAAAYTRVTAQS